MLIFSKNSLQTKLFKLIIREKTLVLAIYNNNIFNINDKKRKMWKKNRELSLQPKKKEKKFQYLNFLSLLQNFAFLTLCLIINFFKIDSFFDKNQKLY